MHQRMISVEQAKKIILKNILPIREFEYLTLSFCLGRIAAIDIKSKGDIPPFDNSAMDGFAVRARDVHGASRQSPVILEVIEDVPAGYVAQRIIKLNQAIRIMTGAPIPKGADAVIMVENTSLVTSNQPAPARYPGGPGKPVTRKK